MRIRGSEPTSPSPERIRVSVSSVLKRFAKFLCIVSRLVSGWGIVSDGGMVKVEAEALELVVGVLSISSMISCEAGFLESNSGPKVVSFESERLQ